MEARKAGDGTYRKRVVLPWFTGIIAECIENSKNQLVGPRWEDEGSLLELVTLIKTVCAGHSSPCQPLHVFPPSIIRPRLLKAPPRKSADKYPMHSANIAASNPKNIQAQQSQSGNPAISLMLSNVVWLNVCEDNSLREEASCK